jgi:hypothetical protein
MSKQTNNSLIQEKIMLLDKLLGDPLIDINQSLERQMDLMTNPELHKDLCEWSEEWLNLTKPYNDNVRRKKELDRQTKKAIEKYCKRVVAYSTLKTTYDRNVEVDALVKKIDFSGCPTLHWDKNGKCVGFRDELCCICMECKWEEKFTVKRDNGFVEHNCEKCYKESYDD